jgi:hypothetical protein
MYQLHTKVHPSLPVWAISELHTKVHPSLPVWAISQLHTKVHPSLPVWAISQLHTKVHPSPPVWAISQVHTKVHPSPPVWAIYQVHTKVHPSLPVGEPATLQCLASLIRKGLARHATHKQPYFRNVRDVTYIPQKDPSQNVSYVVRWILLGNVCHVPADKSTLWFNR